MSSFDEANGLVNFNGFDDPDNYICLPPGDYTYMERDSLLKRASVRWISEHPFKYVSQLPFKLAALYCEDTWTERVKPDMGFRVVLSKVEGNNMKMMELIVSLALKKHCLLHGAFTILLLRLDEPARSVTRAEYLSSDPCFRHSSNGFVRDHFPLSLSLFVCDNNLCGSGS